MGLTQILVICGTSLDLSLVGNFIQAMKLDFVCALSLLSDATFPLFYGLRPSFPLTCEACLSLGFPSGPSVLKAGDPPTVLFVSITPAHLPMSAGISSSAHKVLSMAQTTPK